MSEPRSRKTRRLKLAVVGLLFLAAGAAVNVAVACAIKRLGLSRMPTPFVRNPENKATTVYFGSGWTLISKSGIGGLTNGYLQGLVVTEEQYDSLVPRWSVFCGNDPTLQSPLVEQGLKIRGLIEFACGWPMHSLRGTVLTLNDSKVERIFDRTLIVPRNSFLFRNASAFFLPYGPLWPGFAINSLFYAAILWLLWITPGKVKRYSRIFRGRCPACAYSIAPNTCAASGGPCSECGTLLPASMQTSKHRNVEMSKTES